MKYMYLPKPVTGKVSIFNLSKAGLNLEFSFPHTGCLTKAKEPNRLYYLPIFIGRRDTYIYFLKSIDGK